jgi:hypothetical protein
MTSKMLHGCCQGVQVLEPNLLKSNLACFVGVDGCELERKYKMKKIDG